MKRKTGCHKLLLWVMAIAAGLAAGCAMLGYGLYRGKLQFNHPSKKNYPVRGVDVSHYQGDINWTKLAEQGVEFAYIKATEGSSHADERFGENWEGASAAGVKAGAYHFFSFDSHASTQLAHFIRTVPVQPDKLPPAVDVEFYGDKKANPPDADAVYMELKKLLDGLESHYGARPVIYATEEAWELYVRGRFDQYPLWIRSVLQKPDIGKAEWTFWQYSNRGHLEGYEGEEEFIDLNVYGGSRQAWEEWLGDS